ncbi:Abi family protein [bacterium]|nr:Abi family protein [bacterium]
MVANGKELPATIEQQAELLLSRGLCGISKQDLISRLKTVSCYRLSNYFYPYMDDSRTFFLENSNWDLIWNDYCMDSRLRSILFVGLSHIEIAFRTQLEVVMAQKYNPQWYADEKNFFNKNRFLRDVAELKENWKRSDEDFKKSYDAECGAADLPPSWMMFETSTFGNLSKIFENIDSSVPEKAAVAQFFGFSKAAVHILVSWMRNLTNVRNICAHHSRLFSRKSVVKPKFPKDIRGNWVSSWPDSGKIYASVCIVKKLLDACGIDCGFMSELKAIATAASCFDMTIMGFPENWKKEPLFQE